MHLYSCFWPSEFNYNTNSILALFSVPTNLCREHLALLFIWCCAGVCGGLLEPFVRTAACAADNDTMRVVRLK